MLGRLFVIFFFFCACSSFASVPVERYLFAVGANNGGNDRPVLRYAQSDASAFSKVLVEMGGVPGLNKVLLRDPSVQAIKNEFDALDKKLAQQSGARKEILFYYSGHADEGRWRGPGLHGGRFERYEGLCVHHFGHAG